MPRERRLPKRFRSSDDSDQEASSSIEKKYSSGIQPTSPSKKKKKGHAKQVHSTNAVLDRIRSSSVKTEKSITKKVLHENRVDSATSLNTPIMMNPATTVNNYPPNNYGNLNSYNQQQTQPPITMVNHSGYHGNVPLQPVILNPNDPSAPAIYPCGICHREVHDNDDAILCESSCNFWFHRVCTGMTEAAYTLLTAEQSAEWVCDKCIAKKKTPMVRIKKLPLPEILT